MLNHCSVSARFNLYISFTYLRPLFAGKIRSNLTLFLSFFNNKEIEIGIILPISLMTHLFKLNLSDQVFVIPRKEVKMKKEKAMKDVEKNRKKFNERMKKEQDKEEKRLKKVEKEILGGAKVETDMPIPTVV